MKLTADGRAAVLDDGSVMPLLGLGVWQVPEGPECMRAVRWALELGYRHVDTAQAYGNEAGVGKALRESGIARDELFITTKFFVHWPARGATRAWPGMEKAHARPLGTGRHLGDAVVAGIADRVSRTPAQVLLRWCVQRGIPVVGKSTHRERIEENAQIFDFELSAQDMADLDALDHTGQTDKALERKWW